MKKLLCLLLLLVIPGCGLAGTQGELRIAVASDLHYLSPRLVGDEDRLLRIVRAADGKVTQYSPQIAAAFVAKMLEEKPDCVILSGDLTLNGSRESHEELIGLLSPLRDAGIPVLVIPGNHDCTGSAFAFSGSGAMIIPGMDEAGFGAAYHAFGPQEAIARDEASFSYVYALSDALWLLMLDTNTADAPNDLKDETLAWAEAQLQRAREAGARVIGVMHQNLLVHYTGFSAGFQINHADRLAALYSRYGVRLNLSGHMHLQHIGQTAEQTEIDTSALSVWPHHYGMITVQDDTAAYTACPLDVAEWAESVDADDPALLDFDAYSRDFFDAVTRDKLLPQVQPLPVAEEEKERMLQYAVDFNRCMFAGRTFELTDHSAMALWEAHLPQAYFTVYMRSLLRSAQGDMLHAAVPLN